MAAGRIGVLIVDDHELVRTGVTGLLASAADIDVLGEAGSCKEAVQQARRLTPDVILLDVRMPDGDGLGVVEALKRESPKSSVIVLTAYEDLDYLARAVAVGAAGYVLKGVRRADLVSAIHAAATGASFIDRELLPVLMQRISAASPAHSARLDDKAGGLTRREVEVLHLIVEGLSNKEIAERLRISLDTVKSHVQHVIQKLGVSDRTQAAVFAMRKGLFS